MGAIVERIRSPSPCTEAINQTKSYVGQALQLPIFVTLDCAASFSVLRIPEKQIASGIKATVNRS